MLGTQSDFITQQKKIHEKICIEVYYILSS